MKEGLYERGGGGVYGEGKCREGREGKGLSGSIMGRYCTIRTITRCAIAIPLWWSWATMLAESPSTTAEKMSKT